LVNVMQAVLFADTRTPPMSRPACAVGLFTCSRSPTRAPVTVKHCSTAVFAATDAGESVAVSL
jgi:hypothetical protein